MVRFARVDERQFFTEKPEQRPATLPVPALPPHQRLLDQLDAAHEEGPDSRRAPTSATARCSARVKDHLIRVDDDVTCKTCGKRFEIPSHRALVFLEELEGLPQEDYDE